MTGHHYADLVPDSELNPTHVLTRDAVRWGINKLASRNIHPSFAVYLYLRKQARAGRLEESSPEDMKPLLAMPGTPNKPHYLPLVARGATGQPLPTFWRAENLAGMWSQASLYRQVPARWMTDGTKYLMPDDNAELALSQLLGGVPVSAVALGAYFLRNYGFVIEGTPQASDVVSAFRATFDFPANADREFTSLFTADTPAEGFDWFEEAGGELEQISSVAHFQENDV